MTDFQAMVEPHVEALLDPGEQVLGVAAATQTSMFKGRMVALATTDRRLIVLPLSRKFAPAGAPTSITPDVIVKAKGGDKWYELTATNQLRLTLTDGTKLKLMFLAGGEGPFGQLAGGTGQQAGVNAVAEWFERAGP